MKKIAIISLFLFTFIYGKSLPRGIYAIAIFDEKGIGENVQHTRKTKNDYNGICYTKIFILGELFHSNPEVTIGTSRGHYQSRIPIFNNKKIKIGEELLYKHYNVKKGYIEVSLYGKIYDTKVYVK